MILIMIMTLIMTLIMINNRGLLRKTNKYTHFVINTHYYVFRCCILLGKTAGGHTAEGLAQGVPITLRSLVVRSTARAQTILQLFYRFLIFVGDAFFPEKKPPEGAPKA